MRAIPASSARSPGGDAIGADAALRLCHQIPGALEDDTSLLNFPGQFNKLVGGATYIRPMQVERRSKPREKMKLPATVVLDDGRVRIHATLEDLSAEGLRVQVPHQTEISDGGYVLFARRMEPFRVVWQTADRAGLILTKPD